MIHNLRVRKEQGEAMIGGEQAQDNLLDVFEENCEGLELVHSSGPEEKEQRGQELALLKQRSVIPSERYRR